MQSRLIYSTQRVIQRYGKDFTYTRVIEGVYDVNTSSVVLSDESPEKTVRAYRAKISYSESQNPNLIGKDSAVFMVAGITLDFVPQVGDRIKDDSDEVDYEVTMINKIEVNDTVALWRLIACRS